jgi:hypothetical protein
MLHYRRYLPLEIADAFIKLSNSYQQESELKNSTEIASYIVMISRLGSTS